MKKSDITMIVVIYAIVGVFFSMTMKFSEDARIYPLVIMAILVILNTVYLIKCLREYRKEKKIENDFPKLFQEFQKKQFFGTLILCIAYIALINVIGFYVTTAVYMLGTLLFFKVKPKYIVITLICFLAIVYGTFTLFLNVPLPAGLLI